MSFRAAALTLLLFISSVPAAAQSKELRIGVDRRVELIAIIFKLAGSDEFNRTNLPQYSADIEQFFGPQRNHEAVTLARGLRDRYGVAQSRVMAIPIRLSDPPQLKERVPFDSVSGWPAPPAEIRRFVEAARRFAIQARASEFFASHRTLYDSVNGRIRPPLERAVDLAWFAPYFGIKSDQIFVVVPLLVASEGNYGPCMQPPAERRECYSIVGNTRPDSTGYPHYDAGMAGVLLPEFCPGSSRISIPCPIVFPRCRRATTRCDRRSCRCRSRMDRIQWIQDFKNWWCGLTGRCGMTAGACCRFLVRPVLLLNPSNAFPNSP